VSDATTNFEDKGPAQARRLATARAAEVIECLRHYDTAEGCADLLYATRLAGEGLEVHAVNLRRSSRSRRCGRRGSGWWSRPREVVLLRPMCCSPLVRLAAITTAGQRHSAVQAVSPRPACSHRFHRVL
jgi:hypothetical protein